MFRRDLKLHFEHSEWMLADGKHTSVENGRKMSISRNEFSQGGNIQNVNTFERFGVW